MFECRPLFSFGMMNNHHNGINERWFWQLPLEAHRYKAVATFMVVIISEIKSLCHRQIYAQTHRTERTYAHTEILFDTIFSNHKIELSRHFFPPSNLFSFRQLFHSNVNFIVTWDRSIYLSILLQLWCSTLILIPFLIFCAEKKI